MSLCGLDRNDPQIFSANCLHQTDKSHEAVHGSVPWTPPEKRKRHVLESLPHSSGPSTAKTGKDGPSSLTCTAKKSKAETALTFPCHSELSEMSERAEFCNPDAVCPPKKTSCCFQMFGQYRSMEMWNAFLAPFMRRTGGGGEQRGPQPHEKAKPGADGRKTERRSTRPPGGRHHCNRRLGAIGTSGASSSESHEMCQTLSEEGDDGLLLPFLPFGQSLA